MKKKEAKKLIWKLTEGVGKLDNKDLWFIYYRVKDFRVKEPLWDWEVVLEYQGILLFRIQIDQLEDVMIIDGKLRKYPFSINFETKEIVIW